MPPFDRAAVAFATAWDSSALLADPDAKWAEFTTTSFGDTYSPDSFGEKKWQRFELRVLTAKGTAEHATLQVDIKVPAEVENRQAGSATELESVAPEAPIGTDAKTRRAA